MIRPISPVLLTVIISINETISVTSPAVTGPIIKPAMTMITSFRSNDRNPDTAGITLDTSFATNAMAHSIPTVVIFFTFSLLFVFMKNSFRRAKKSSKDISPEHAFFFHPDYTVGIGIAPIHARGSQTVTAGGDLHPALKIYFWMRL